jgi:hypothetical protein
MKQSWLIVLLGIAIAAPAHAQIGVYGKLDAVRLNAASPGVAASTTWYYGPGAGIYDDFLHLGPISLGADLRGDYLWGNEQQYRSALFGLRLAAKPPILPIKPYVQGSVGVGGASHGGLNGSGSIFSNKFQYQVLGGLDYTFFPHLDLRLVEVGYGRMSGISSSGVAPEATLFTLSAGLAIRLP